MAPVRAALGLDVGTSLVKCNVIDEAGLVRGTATSAPVPLAVTADGRAEQDPTLVWDAVVEVLRTTLGTLDDSVSVSSIAVAAASGSLLALGADERPATPLFTWLDTRAAPIVASWEEDGTAASIRAVTGWWPAPGLGLALLASMREDGRLQAAARIGGLDSFVVHRLARAWVTNPSNAAGLQLMDLHGTAWSRRLCALAGIDESALPAIRLSGAPVGAVAAPAAAATGLPVGLPVYGGAHDQAATALALGLSDLGDVLVSGGTAWVLTMTAAEADVERAPRTVNVGHHAVAGRWLHSRFLGGFGADLARLAAEGASDAGDGSAIFAGLDAEVGAATPALDDLHFAGGSFYGERGLLSAEAASRRPRATRARAVMEHAAYQLGEALAASGAADVIDVTLVGGAASSKLWPQILADATGLGVLVAPAASWPATGAALLAGTASGVFPSVEEGAATVSGPHHRVAPDPARAEMYRLRETVHSTLEREEG